MKTFPQGNKFCFAHWSQSTLQDSNSKNTQSSILEGFPSLLSDLSLNLPRQHSAQFMTIYRLNICFSFPFFLLSTFHSWPRVHAAEEEVENAGQNILCSTILCHFLPAWQSPAIWRVEITFPRIQHIWTLWTQEDEHQPKPFWTALIFQPPGKSTTLFIASQMCWNHFMHSVQHLQKCHKTTGRNAGALHITN